MELKEYQKKIVNSVKGKKEPIYFSFPYRKNVIFKQQREGRMSRNNSKEIDIVEYKKQFFANVSKDKNMKKQKKNKNRDVR